MSNVSHLKEVVQRDEFSKIGDRLGFVGVDVRAELELARRTIDHIKPIGAASFENRLNDHYRNLVRDLENIRGVLAELDTAPRGTLQ